MKKINKILCPTDFSESSLNACRYAIWFADKQGASILLWHAVTPEVEALDVPVVSGAMTEKKIESAKEVMQSYVSTSLVQAQTVHDLEAVPNISSDVGLGIPAKSIVDKAKEEEVDLIIMGTQGEHSTLERIFGSVATATITYAECPVLVVPESKYSDKISCLAYASDLMDSDPYRIWETIQLFKGFNPAFKVIHVQDEKDENEDLEMQDLKEFFDKKAEDVRISFHISLGKDVVKTIEDFCDNHYVDLLVMPKPQRSFLERLFHSSVTRQSALNAKIPLLIMR